MRWDGRVDYCACLESRWPSASWVRIPVPPHFRANITASGVSARLRREHLIRRRLDSSRRVAVRPAGATVSASSNSSPTAPPVSASVRAPRDHSAQKPVFVNEVSEVCGSRRLPRRDKREALVSGSSELCSDGGPKSRSLDYGLVRGTATGDPGFGTRSDRCRGPIHSPNTQKNHNEVTNLQTLTRPYVTRARTSA